MGFYNYYRLLKELRYFLRNKKVKRFLTIIIIFIIVISILHTKGYCATPNYNIYPPYHNTDYYTEMLIRPLVVSNDLYFNFNTYKIEHDPNIDKIGWYFEMVQGWTYFIVNNTGSPMNWCTTSDVPSPGVSFSSFNTNQNNQTYYQIGDNGGSGYCYFYTSDTSAVFTVYAYCYDQYMYLDKSTAEYYLNSINSWVYQLKTQNNQNLDDIKQMLHDYIYGDSSLSEYPITSSSVNKLFFSANTQTFITNNEGNVVYFPIKNGYNYKFTVNTSSNSVFLRYGTCFNIPAVGGSGTFINSISNKATDYLIDYNSTLDGYYFFSFSGISGQTYSVTCVSNYNEAQELGLSQTIINNNNNNTQIIDNTLTNSDISVEDNQLVTDDTNDITQDGFSNLFTAIRNAFTGSPSAIVLPLGFLGNGQQLILQPDFVSSAMQTGGLGVLVTVINAFWYFVVCRYIVKRISKIINNFKEGNLEETTGNIRTEVF